MPLTSLAALGIVSLIVSAFVQYLKKRSQMHALVILALVSFGVSAVYATLVGVGWWDKFWEVGSLIAVTANAVYNVLKAAYDALGGDDSQAHLDA